MRWVTVGHIEAFPPGTVRAVEVEGRVVVICNVAGEFFAVRNSCPHKGGPLGEGWLRWAILICPWHRFRYDLRRGCSVTDETLKIRIYPVQVEGSVLKIQM